MSVIRDRTKRLITLPFIKRLMLKLFADAPDTRSLRVSNAAIIALRDAFSRSSEPYGWLERQLRGLFEFVDSDVVQISDINNYIGDFRVQFDDDEPHALHLGLFADLVAALTRKIGIRKRLTPPTLNRLSEVAVAYIVILLVAASMLQLQIRKRFTLQGIDITVAAELLRLVEDVEHFDEDNMVEYIRAIRNEYLVSQGRFTKRLRPEKAPRSAKGTVRRQKAPTSKRRSSVASNTPKRRTKRVIQIETSDEDDDPLDHKHSDPPGMRQSPDSPRVSRRDIDTKAHVDPQSEPDPDIDPPSQPSGTDPFRSWPTAFPPADEKSEFIMDLASHLRRVERAVNLTSYQPEILDPSRSKIGTRKIDTRVRAESKTTPVKTVPSKRRRRTPLESADSCRPEDIEGAGTIGNGVIIRKSNIPNAGYGVFATKDYPEGSAITEYDGMIINRNLASLGYRLGQHSHFKSLPDRTSVVYGLRPEMANGGQHMNRVFAGRGAASMVNDADTNNNAITCYTLPGADLPIPDNRVRYPPPTTDRQPRRRNRSRDEARIWYRATRDIRNGEEILAPYGARYWKDVRENKFKEFIPITEWR